MPYSSSILLNTYINAVNGKYDIILQNIDKLGNRYIKGTTKTAYRKIHSILTTILEKIMSHPSKKKEYLADLVEVSILIRYQSERNQLNHNLAKELISILENYINNIDKLNDEDVRKHARAIKMIIDSILAFYYRSFT